MHKAAVLLTVIGTLSIPAAAPRAQEQPAIAQQKMATYYLVLLNKGSGPAASSTEEARVRDGHIKHFDKLAADGIAHVAGPIGDDGPIRGIAILSATSTEHARELANADPAVQAGRFAPEILAFMAPAGWFHKPATPPSTEQLYFGFLKSGPSRSQDAETAQRLQKEHLAYMDGQHKEGKLVMAGPFLQGGARRGIVIYRVADAAEAKTRAEGDPMIKAGRLVVELHPWHVARGVFRTP